ncbi:acetate--CoA ligase family protein [Rhodococcus globerulus]|uniref:acetate--CoA ligase family protein n=1 Tax=Rhodococcus globerulus TaxID=33008 RepID=UPI0014032BED|nr:acetate--CoA ligase family protein [Rhodococcus globerulus]
MTTTQAPTKPLKMLLTARSVAIVGVREESFWSQRAVQNMRAFGFDGDVHLVHPTRQKQFDLPCAPSISGIGERIDLVLSLTGPLHLPAILADAAESGARGLVSIASGLAEHSETGRQLQDQLVADANNRGISLLGPNCVGFVDFRTGLAPFTDRISPPMQPGPVGVVSQSGALLQLIHRAAQRNSAGLGAMFSVGNEAMLTAVDVIDELLDRSDIRCVAGYIEGVKDPRRFVEVARKALSLGKPIVLLKAGRSNGAARLAMAHTGSLTGDDRVVDAVFEKYGVTRVSSPEELIETAAALSRLSAPAGRRIAVVSSSGGACSIAADLIEASELELPELSAATSKELRGSLPEFGTPQNPLDTTGIVVDKPKLLGECLEILGRSDEFDQILVNLDLPPHTDGEDDLRGRLDAVAAMCHSVPIPVLLSSTIAGDVCQERRAHVAGLDQHMCDGLAQAVAVANHLARYGIARNRARVEDIPAGQKRLVSSRRPALSELESMTLLSELGLPVNPTRRVTTADEAIAAAKELGMPVVAKIHSDTILHKSDIGGVKVGLTDEAAVRAAFCELSALAEDHDVDGVLIARMIEGTRVELIAGVVIEDTWDPVVAIGAGGVFTEVISDIALGVAPLSSSDAAELLAKTRASVLMAGFRGEAPLDTAPVIEFLVALSQAAVTLSESVAAIDINPLFVVDGFVVAGDALVVLKDRSDFRKYGDNGE